MGMRVYVCLSVSVSVNQHVSAEFSMPLPVISDEFVLDVGK